MEASLICDLGSGVVSGFTELGHGQSFTTANLVAFSFDAYIFRVISQRLTYGLQPLKCRVTNTVTCRVDIETLVQQKAGLPHPG